MWWKKKKPELEQVQTECGTFIKNGIVWVGEAKTSGGLIEVITSDVKGEPNPAFLLRLPAILERLDTYEADARDYTAGLLTDAFSMSLECYSSDGEEFSLIFSYNGAPEFLFDIPRENDETIGNLVTVHFKAREIVYYSAEWVH